MKHCITWWVGLDDSADKIDVAIFQNQEEEPREEIEVWTDERSLGGLSSSLRVLVVGSCSAALTTKTRRPKKREAS